MLVFFTSPAPSFVVILMVYFGAMFESLSSALLDASPLRIPDPSKTTHTPAASVSSLTVFLQLVWYTMPKKGRKKTHNAVSLYNPTLSFLPLFSCLVLNIVIYYGLSPPFRLDY